MTVYEKRIYRGGARRLGMALLLAVCCVAASCTSKAVQRQASMDKALDEGDYIAMIEELRKNGKKLYGEANAFLYNMDIGVLFHYAGEYDSSNVYLMKAAEIHDQLFAKSVTNEAAALLTNDNVRPYRSKPYELVMLHQLTALNFMVAGKFQEALVESRKVQLLMNEWERTQGKDGKYYTDGMFHLLSSLAYERVGEADNSLISLFKSVQAYKLGPVKLPGEVSGFAYDRLKAGDRENDVSLLKLGPNGGGNRWSAGQGASEIIVLGYAGKGPVMKEQNWYGSYIPGGRLRISVQGTSNVIDILAPPLPAGKSAGEALNIKVSLPELHTYAPKAAYFTARSGEASEVKSVIINDMDRQAKKALDDAWDEILTRTVIRVVLRTIAANEVKKRTNTGNALADMALKMGTDAAAASMEKADVRMCFLLPKTIQMARIPVPPGTHSVSLNVYDGHGNVVGKREYNNIEVKGGEKKVILAGQLVGGKSEPAGALPSGVPELTPPEEYQAYDAVPVAAAEASPDAAGEVVSVTVITEETTETAEGAVEEPAAAQSAPPPDTAKPLMAVYVAGAGDAEQEATLVIIGSALTKAVKDIGKYSAKNLPASVLAQHGHAVKGTVLGKQAADICKEFGARYLCVVEPSVAPGQPSNLNARLLDAAAGETVKTALASVTDLEDIGQIVEAAQKIAKELSAYEAPPPVQAAAPAQPAAAAGGADAVALAFVKGGAFTMGCTAEQGNNCFEFEKPAHNVALSDFYIGKYEVTQKQWVQVMGTNPSLYKGDDFPVESVSWHDAQEFIAKLNAMTGKKYRLPTEAEWEYAARGGPGGRMYMYAGSNNIDEVAWYNGNSGGKTGQAGGKKPNQLGLYDMSGNVNEWTGDWYGPYASGRAVNPAGPGYGNYRVVRGGIWSDEAKHCRVSNRASAPPDFKTSNLGFRLALTADAADKPPAAAAPAAPPQFVPAGKQPIAVYVRGGIADGEVRAAFAEELLFEFVKSGRYKPVENSYAFTAAADRAASGQGAGGGLSEAQIAGAGVGAGAGLICIVDATPIYETVQFSARVIDVSSATVVKMCVVDGKKITSAEEISAVVEKIAGVIVGDAAEYAQTAQTPPEEEPSAAYAAEPDEPEQGAAYGGAPPEQPAGPAPSYQAPPAPPRVVRYAPPPKPKREIRVSLGAGSFFAGGYGGGVEWPSGARVIMPYSGGGGYAFFDAEYMELVMGYYAGGGKWESRAASDSDKLPDMPRSNIDFGVFVKFPFGGESVRAFPLFGLDYEAATSGELKYGGSKRSLDGGLSALWFKLGAGLDISLSKNLYLRPEFLFGWRTANGYEKSLVGTEKDYGNSGVKAVSGSGLAVKLGAGYKF